MAEESTGDGTTRRCALQIVQRIATIEADLKGHAKRVDEHIAKESEVHSNLSKEIKDVHDQNIKYMRYVIALLMAVLGYLVVHGAPWT